ncbi:MAG: cation:proton antiporter [Christensenellales bacterium]
MGLDLQANAAAQVIVSLAVMLLAGFLMTRLTKPLKLPNVTGYILAGVCIGPYALNLIPQSLIGSLDFVTDVALAFIAFGVGKYFKLSQLKKSGKQVLVVTVFEALLAAAVVTLTMYYVFHLSLAFSLLLGAIGSATAPASTIMTIRQYKAKGPFVNMILQVVALDDAVALIAFSVCAAVAQALQSTGTLDQSVILMPLVINLVALVLGVMGGWVMHKLINEHRSNDHRLVLVVAIILSLTGFCTIFGVSPLLSCMLMGTVYINLSGNKKLFKQVNGFTPPVLLLFFVLSGMRLNVPALATAGVIGVVYFFVRILGKYLGASLGAWICKCPANIKKYLGMALIPQAGVSIGLAALGARMLPGEMGVMLSTIILSSAVLYEMIGPACAKASLFLSGTIQRGEKPAAPAEEALPEATADAPSAEPAQPQKRAAHRFAHLLGK